MTSISIVNTKIFIDNKPLTKYLADQKAAITKAKRGNAVVRTVVLRYFSDFIAQQGLLREATKSGNFSKDSTRPDIQASLAAFKKTFGVDFAPTEITGRSAEAFAELKQRTSASRAVTLTSIQLSSDILGKFIENFNLQRDINDKGQATFTGRRIDQIPKDEILQFINRDAKLRQEIIASIVQKFENFVIIDYLDKDRDARPKVKVLANANNILELRSLDSKTIDIVARVVKDGDGKRAYIRLEFKLSEAGYKLFIEKAADATEKFHASLSKNVSTSFIKYAIRRFDSGKAKSDVTAFLQEVISIAKEFETGSDTPVVYETQIPLQKQGNTSLKITFPVTPRQKTSKSATQTFISGIQWTVLTQRRLGETMLRMGDPEPPELKERSGRFRQSVQVVPNYRLSLLQYNYNPLYRSLQKYGYKPDLQVETAIREVAQSLYMQRFRIVRTSSV